jgi:hypothetical protein
MTKDGGIGSDTSEDPWVLRTPRGAADEALGLAELTHEPGNNRMRAR